MAISTDHSDIPLAIIGMGCRLPGAENLEQYWRLIVEGRCAIAEVPAERLDQQLYYDPQKGVRGKTYAKLAALLANRDFDAQRYPIADELRRSVDKPHLMMTSVAADAVRHAGLDPFNLGSKNTAVFIGNGGSCDRLRNSTYQMHLAEGLSLLEQGDEFRKLSPPERRAVREGCLARINHGLASPQTDPRFLHCNMMAGTVAKAFGLTGGWLALNSACASSLQAILMGARTLQQGRAEMVIVGGASEIHAHTLVLFSQAQALSSCGSRPFDADADGLVMSEGYVALVLKTLERALADGDPIQAVVRGLGVATDGRGKSLWAPRKEGQIKAMRRAYRSGVELSGLQYIECHATATQLGDATELETLGEVLRPEFPHPKRIPVTSVKANIGHALEAAGIAGVIKTILCIQHKTVPPAINVRTLNPKIDWQAAPYYVPTSPVAWDAPAAGQPRRAAVNAFGIGGLNMHVVLDEFTDSAHQLIAPRRGNSSQRQQVGLQSAPTADEQTIAIIGMGCILPGAIGLAPLWQTLESGADPKSVAKENRWSKESIAQHGENLTGAVGGFVTDFAYDWRKHKVPPKQVAEADPLQFMLLEAVEQALNDAKFERTATNRERCGVVVGTEVGGDFCDQLEMGLRLPEMQPVVADMLRAQGVPQDRIEAINASFAETLLKKWPSLIDETGSFTSSTLASRVTKTLDLAGGAVAVDSGSTGALSALAVCCDMLLSGDNDVMICAAGQRSMNASAFASLQKFGLLSGSNPRNVLDGGYDGIVPGEGVGVLVLKRLADARRNGDRIHAVIRGIALAHHSSPAEAARLAAERACAQAGVDPAEIQFLELETDERLSVDGQELQALAAAHGGPGRRQPLSIGSPTAQFGHLGGGAGVTALLKASLEIENGRTVSAVGLQSPSAALGGWTHVAHAAGTAAPLTGRRLGAVAAWSKGQAGYVILEQGLPVPVQEPAAPPAASQKAATPAARPASVQPVANGIHRHAPVSLPPAMPTDPVRTASEWQICRLAGATWEQLLSRIDAVQADMTSAWRAAAAGRFGTADRFRLAIVADNAESWLRKLQLARGQLANPAARSVLEQQGVFFRELPAARPRVVFVFPGQGSQYAGMLRDLVRDVPAAATALQNIDTVLSKLGYTSFSELAWSDSAAAPATRLGSDLWTTQLAMCVADAVMLAALRDRGIEPDLVLGHSYGEFPALLAAGAWDVETTIRLTRARCEGIATASAHDTGLLATDAAPRLIEQLAATISAELHLANYNAPDQTVVGGRRAHLEALAAALQSQSRQARLLAVPAAFHTPLMTGASLLLERALAGATIRPLGVPLVSTVTNRAVGNAAEIRGNLARQLTTPVRYSELIANLAAERPSVFVEVGPQQTLTRLNRRILESAAGGGTAVIASDNPKRPGIEPLLCVQALLECLGAFPAVAQSPSPVAARSASVLTPTQPSKPMDDTTLHSDAQHSEIPHFDATERRRSKMRTAQAGTANRERNGATAPAANAPAAAAPAGRNGNSPTGGTNGEPHHAASAPAARFAVAMPVEAAAPAATVRPPHPAPTPPVSAPTHPQPAHGASAEANGSTAAGFRQAPCAPEQLEQFLVKFVVEQTGYPPEVVDLDADLEADLGIDSIKKAQLFGELGEFFDIGQLATNLVLDDFPTLRHVLNFLESSQTATTVSTVAAPQQSAAIATPAAPQTVLAPTAPAVVASAASAPVPALNGAPQGGVELESFLVNFVVEQTGYPAEVVDLDADLEADLGIDSIKKAQLFGELGEFFDIGASAGNLSLDEFPTLRHVLNFLSQAGSPAAVSEPVHPAAAVVAPVAVPLAAVTAAVVPSAAAPASTASGPAPVGAELESFLINFVVEQTGYPAEVVDLDADLEADLGIDSIKKAQLFGELGEFFDIGSSAANLSLDEFPTLRHVLNFLSQTAAPVVASQPVPVAGGNGSVPAPAAPLVATVQSAALTAHSPVGPVSPVSQTLPGGADLESFLINFVVEQTGYPAEVVDLDADLEADLGIDSIKKAQLFGELGEFIELGASTTELSLDKFPTLRHVLNFLQLAGARPDRQQQSSTATAAQNGHSAGSMPPGTSAAAQDRNGHAQPQSHAPRVAAHGAAEHGATTLAGSPYEIGWQHGQAFKNQIRAALRRYAETADIQLAELPGAARSTRPEQSLSADELDELQGLADAVEVPLGNVLAHHFAIASESGAGAGQMAIPAANNAGGQQVLALRQPLPLTSVLAEVLVPSVFIRTPTHGLAHAAIVPIGTVGIWGGLNAAGVAVVSHPLQSTPARAISGRSSTAVARLILEVATDLDSAVELARSLPASEPWRACISHSGTDRVACLEHDGRNLIVRAAHGLICEGQLELHAEESLSAIVARLGTAESNGHNSRPAESQSSQPLHASDLIRDLSNHHAGAGSAWQPGGSRSTVNQPGALALAIEPAAGDIWLSGRQGPERCTVSKLLPMAARQSAQRTRSSIEHRIPALPPESICSRFSLEMRAAPLPAGLPSEPTWTGAAIILGTNPTAAALVDRLRRSGVTVHSLSPDGEVAATVAQLEQICAAGPAPHLFITTTRDGVAIDIDHPADWNRERHQSMVVPFFVCQKWMQLAAQGHWLDRCSLVATTSQEGEFGFSRGAEMAQGGALAGLLKAIFVEFTIMQEQRSLRIKVVDAPADAAADQLAGDIFRELASGSLDDEVAFVDGRRFVPMAIEGEPVATGDSGIQPGGTWIVTGGARGITAACALELGRRYDLQLHLIGSTPLAQVDPAWRNLDDAGLKQLKASIMIAARGAGQNAAQAWERTKKDLEIDRSMSAFADAGVSVTYHTCDVADRAALAKTLDAIRQADGPIAGIVHGAGIERSCRFDRKQRDVVLQTIDVKVGGAANLMSLTRRDPIRHFVGFGSISGRLGGFGQTDYSLANEMLAKLVGAYRRQRPWIKGVTFHWHPWGEVGMAARPELKNILEGKGSLGFMLPAEGIAHMLRELAAGAPEPEILITERQHWERFSAGLREVHQPASGNASAQGSVASSAAAGSPSVGAAAKLPLIQEVHREGEHFVALVPLDPLQDSFLVEHRLRARPLLPAVAGLEAMAELAQAASGKRVVGFSNVDMIDGLLFHTDRPVVAQVRALPRADGNYDCELTCDFHNRAGGLIKKDRPYLRATVEVALAPLALESRLGAMPDASQWLDIAYPDHALVYHGTPFRGVTSGYLYDGADGWVKILALPLEDLTGPGRAAGWIVPSVILDSAMYGCGLHLWARGGNVIALPKGIEHLQLGRLPRDGEVCWMYAVCRELSAERPCYDFELIGEDRSVLMRARGYYKVAFGRGDAL